MEDLPKLRPVGRLERYSTARHDLRFYLNAGVTASYTLPENCPLPLKNYIYEACGTLIGQHPILSAIPVDENTNRPQFVRLPEILLDRCIFFHDRRHGVPKSTENDLNFPGSDAMQDIELDELLSIQHNIPFAPPYPFWRLCVLTNVTHPYRFTAAFIFHHAIGDGISGKAFHKTFQRALSQALAASANPLTSVITAPLIPLLPNVEAIHSMPVSIRHLLSVVFKEKFWSRRDRTVWTGSRISVPLNTQVRHFPFSRSDTSTFKDLCRANSTTVTAALQTIIAGTLFSQLPDNFTKLQCTGTLSTRRWLPDSITDDCIGVWIQDYSESYSRNRFRTECLPWDEAKRCRETIEHVLSSGGKNAGPNMLRYVNNYQQELFLSKVGKRRESSYEVSNLGVFKNWKNEELEKHGKGPGVEIGRMVFTQSANVTGSAFEVSAITGGDGCLVLGISWQKGVVEDILIEKVMETVKMGVK